MSAILGDNGGSILTPTETTGGTVSTAGNAELVAVGTGGTLDGVTLAGTLNLASQSESLLDTG